MFCRNCGEKIKANALFCPKCGTKQIDNAITSSENNNENDISPKEEETAAGKFTKVAQKFCFWATIAGIVGVALFLGIVLIGLIIYGRVYLFDGYDFTKVLATISIVLMIIGLLGFIIRCILNFIFKIGVFPATQAKRVLHIILAIACLGCSIWGFADSKNNSNNESSYSSTGGYSSTVDESIGLSLKVTKIETSGNYTYVYCSIKNVSNLYGNPTMYRYIKVKAVFKDKYGTTLDTDWTYAVDSTWLNSGETKTFYYMVRNTSVKSATLSIIN